MEDLSSYNYLFGDFRFSPSNKILRQNGEIVAISPTALDVLGVLLEKHPEPAAREELMQRVWGDTAVEEANITVAISNLRKVLAGDGDQQFIKTIPKKGYLFVADVQKVGKDSKPITAESATSAPEAVPGPTRWVLIAILVLATLFLSSFSYWYAFGDGNEISNIPLEGREYRSVAVLPFKGIGIDNQTLSLGIADNLISRLGKINKFAVRPLSAVDSFPVGKKDALGFGRELRVDAVFVGTIQKSENRLRINVRLLDTRDGAQIWSGRFDETEGEIFELQDKLSVRIAQELATNLSTKDNTILTANETQNLDAFRMYNTGQFYLAKRTRENTQKAIPYFAKATELDSSYAAAYSALARSYLLLTDSATGGKPADVPREKIEAAINRVIELDPQSHEAYASKGFLALTYDWSPEQALVNYDKSIKINPNAALTRNWKAWSLIALKRFDEAGEEMKIARSLDPASSIIATEVGLPLLFEGKYKEAEPYFREAVEMDKSFFQARFRLWNLLFVSGRYVESLEELKALKELSSGEDMFYLGLYASTVAKLGKTDEAAKIFAEIQDRVSKGEYVSPMLLATVAMTLGDNQKAKYWLEQGLSERNDYMLYLELAAEYNPLKKEPWFGEIVKKVKTAGQ